MRFEAGVAVQSQVGPHIYKRRFRVTNIMEDRDSDVFVDHYHYTGVLPAMHRQTLYPPPLTPQPPPCSNSFIFRVHGGSPSQHYPVSRRHTSSPSWEGGG